MQCRKPVQQLWFSVTMRTFLSACMFAGSAFQCSSGRVESETMCHDVSLQQLPPPCSHSWTDKTTAAEGRLARHCIPKRVLTDLLVLTHRKFHQTSIAKHMGVVLKTQVEYCTSTPEATSPSIECYGGAKPTTPPKYPYGHGSSVSMLLRRPYWGQQLVGCFVGWSTVLLQAVLF